MSLSDRDRTIADVPGPDHGRLRKSHASLIVLQGAEIGRDFRLRKSAMIIGRGEDAHIRLPDGGVSRAHASIESSWDHTERRATFVVRDLGSTNRTFVNSTEIVCATLGDGDKIQIGETVMKFVLLDEIEVAFHAEVRDRITYDQLTGLLTKESLYLALEHELQRSLRYERPLAVLMMDLDRFKSVNDTHGHLMGSQVLREVGALIRRSIRTEDVSGRFGGEEFTSYLAELDAAGARPVADRIRSAVADHTFHRDGTTVPVTISIGVAAAPTHGRTVESLVDAADRALYEAKRSGRNRVCTAGEDDLSRMAD